MFSRKKRALEAIQAQNKILETAISLLEDGLIDSVRGIKDEIGRKGFPGSPIGVVDLLISLSLLQKDFKAFKKSFREVGSKTDILE